MVRELGGGVTQTYTLYPSTHNIGSFMFGGFFTQSDTPGLRFAAYALDDPFAGMGG
jgi:hypothetical protein